MPGVSQIGEVDTGHAANGANLQKTGAKLLTGIAGLRTELKVNIAELNACMSKQFRCL